MRGNKILGSVLLALCCTGCGGSLAGASGKVTFDGQTVEDGSISFIGSDPANAGRGVPIIKGEYELPSERGIAPGSYRVEIHSLKKKGTKFDPAMGEEVAVTEEMLPAKYHSNSELKADLKAGNNSLDFDLKP